MSFLNSAITEEKQEQCLTLQMQFQMFNNKTIESFVCFCSQTCSLVLELQ